MISRFAIWFGRSLLLRGRKWGVVVLDLFTRMMYKIYIWTRRPRGRGLVYYLCHPAYAMTGALAWQVNHYLNKIIIFVFLRGDRTGISRVPPLLCVSRFILSTLTLPYNPSLPLIARPQLQLSYQFIDRTILQFVMIIKLSWVFSTKQHHAVPTIEVIKFFDCSSLLCSVVADGKGKNMARSADLLLVLIKASAMTGALALQMLHGEAFPCHNEDCKWLLNLLVLSVKASFFKADIKYFYITQETFSLQVHKARIFEDLMLIIKGFEQSGNLDRTQ
ncbi:hypothetical protein SADUNF_Sadunf07G0023100 [Salix dunnii]|uniref:Uncharacterized protein n=1 Tax=Salix dunnii TaxID=1413687 RepID=A0A835JZ46_9ROSI|nr:hypothetical protein SADUNF_Sadunf07G0023100 [Salix dunnii]